MLVLILRFWFIYIMFLFDSDKRFTTLIYDGGCYHIETSPLICSANQWTGFYMITVSVLKELNPWKFFLFPWTIYSLLVITSSLKLHDYHCKTNCYISFNSKTWKRFWSSWIIYLVVVVPSFLGITWAL